MTTWKPQAGAHKSKYFQKILILASGYHQNHLKVFGCLDSCFCVFMWVIWNFHQKITVARILGHGEEPPELLRPVLEAGKMVKLRQIMQNPEIVATKGLGFLFFFDLFSVFRWSTCWFCLCHYRCDCHSDLRDPGKICCMFWEHSVMMEN